MLWQAVSEGGCCTCAEFEQSWSYCETCILKEKKTNKFLFSRKAIFDTPEDDPNYNPLPEEQPGGFAWGEGQRLGG